MARQLGELYHIPGLLYRLANVAMCRGDKNRAVMLFRHSLILRKETGDKLGLVQTLAGLAGVAHGRRHYEQAARILGAAEALRATTGYHLSTADQSDYDRHVASTRAALGAKSFDAATARGRAMTLDEAVEYALAPAGAAKPAPPGTQKSPLTHRELEVAHLVAQGLTNREIASSLNISERTADAHVQHILNKLGFRARTQIASWSAERGLNTARVD